MTDDKIIKFPVGFRTNDNQRVFQEPQEVKKSPCRHYREKEDKMTNRYEDGLEQGYADAWDDAQLTIEKKVEERLMALSVQHNYKFKGWTLLILVLIFGMFVLGFFAGTIAPVATYL